MELYVQYDKEVPVAHDIQIAETVGQLEAQLKIMRRGSPAPEARDAIALTNLGGGVLRFADAVFPGAGHERIYAELHEREPEGRGAHFDVYGETLDKRYPWLGVFNFAGKLSLTAVKLPDDLAASYFDSFPEPDDTAFKARRDYAGLALKMPNATPLKGELGPRAGMVLLQKPKGPHMIHELIPRDSTDPGEFIKLVCPANTKRGRTLIETTDLVPLEQLVTAGLKQMVSGDELPPLLENDTPSVVDDLRDMLESPEREARTRPPRRKAPCNYD